MGCFWNDVIHLDDCLFIVAFSFACSKLYWIKITDSIFKLFEGPCILLVLSVSPCWCLSVLPCVTLAELISATGQSVWRVSQGVFKPGHHSLPLSLSSSLRQHVWFAWLLVLHIQHPSLITSKLVHLLTHCLTKFIALVCLSLSQLHY